MPPTKPLKLMLEGVEGVVTHQAYQEHQILVVEEEGQEEMILSREVRGDLALSSFVGRSHNLHLHLQQEALR
jgi:hypothetical protein